MVKTKNTQENEIKLSPKEKVIMHLIENKEPQSILSLSGAITMDYKNTYNTIIPLEPEIISREKVGNTSLIKLNMVPAQEICSAENKRTKEFLQKNKEIKLILEDIKSLNYPFFIILVFGSIVKKTSTSKSDIDLCIISDNKEKTKKLISRLKLLSLRLEIHNFSVNEFELMLKTREGNIAKEIVKRNIILYGIENYYNLISKWTKNE